MLNSETPQLGSDATAISTSKQDKEVERQIEILTRRSFMTGTVAGGIGLAGYAWLNWLAFDKSIDKQLQWPFRRMHEFNQSVAKRFLGTSGLAPEFPVSRAREPRTNGRIGLSKDIDLRRWRLKVTQPNRPVSEFSMSDLRDLPKVEMVTELKCVEGWSQVVQWGGVRLMDFLAHYNLGRRDAKEHDSSTRADDLFPFTQLATPDEAYYVGLDADSVVHPQTLLCYEMNGEPLTQAHGAPLRLVATVKYGIKNIKRIGHIRLLDEQPADYWAERGYDWYAGL